MTEQRIAVIVSYFLFRCYVQIGSALTMPEDDERVIALQSLSDAQLIQILQLDDSDDSEPNSLRQLVEAEIARRKKEGAQQ
jgi:hypothetical protein